MDFAFPPGTSQEDMFDTIGKPALDDTMSGYNNNIVITIMTGVGRNDAAALK